MSEIKCLENYKKLREMLLNGEQGDINHYCKRLGICQRSFRRLIKYYEEIEKVSVKYNKVENYYYVE